MSLVLSIQKTEQSAARAGSGKAIPPIVQRRHAPGQDFLQDREGRCPCGGGCPRCQRQSIWHPKLVLDTPGNAFEVEADRVAEAVLSSPEPHAGGIAGEATRAAGLRLQRQCLCGRAPGGAEECECEEEEAALQRAPVGTAPAALAPPIVHDVLHSPGQPLDLSTRAFMERRFGYDFTGVRVHTDAQAAESARAVNALAYTVGRDIVFAAGALAPETGKGRRLLAHELVHVAQQDHSARSEGDREAGGWTPTRASREGFLQRQLVPPLEFDPRLAPDPRLRPGALRLRPPTLMGPREPRFHLIEPEELALGLDPCVPIFDRILDAVSIAKHAVVAAHDRLERFKVTLLGSIGPTVHLDADVYCALKANFNIDEHTPDYSTLVRTIWERLRAIMVRMDRFDPVTDIVCETVESEKCRSEEGRKYRGFATLGGPLPIHLCADWVHNPDLGPKTILHEVAHITGRADHQYIRLITLTPIEISGATATGGEETTLPAVSCRRDRFSIGLDLTVDNADSYAFFAMDFR